jgi:glycosyltransferase involved in cell wall biosynthesis
MTLSYLLPQFSSRGGQTQAVKAGVTKIRVLFVDHTASLGGGEIALANLIRHLNPEKVKPVVVLASEGPLVERLREFAETHVLPLPSQVLTQKKDMLGIASLLRLKEALSVLLYVGSLARFIREHDLDVVHTNSLKADIIGGLAGRLSLRPVIWHVRDRIDDDYLPKPVVRAFRLLSRLIPTFVIANSAATLCTLRQQRKAQEPASSRSVRSNDRTAVVHDGTCVPPLPLRSNMRSEFCVGLVGRISPWKGQHVFIQAAALVAKRFPKTRFLIIGSALFGESPYEEEVRLMPGQLGIADKVEFAGFRNDVEQAIAELDLLVHASTKGEPFGQVIIEGMAAGKPVIATNGGGVPEIVEDGKTGILVPMGDAAAMAEAICQIICDPARAQEMGARARERITDFFTLERTARRVEAVYAKVLRQENITRESSGLFAISAQPE